MSYFPPHLQHVTTLHYHVKKQYQKKPNSDVGLPNAISPFCVIVDTIKQINLINLIVSALWVALNAMSCFGIDACTDMHLRHSSSAWHRRSEAASDEGLAWLGKKCHWWHNGRVEKTSLGVCSCQRRALWAFTIIQEHTMLMFTSKSMLST